MKKDTKPAETFESKELGEVKLTKEQLAQLSPEELDEYNFVRRKTLRQAIKYALCTASAGLLQFVSFTIMTYTIPDTLGNMWFMIDMSTKTFICTTIALALSVLWNFTINRKFTFKSAGNVPRAMFLAFLFYVPFYPFQTWYVPTVTTALGGTDAVSLVAEVTVMLINGVLEFCWQKFFIYRKEEGTSEQHEVDKIGPNGEIYIAPAKFNGLDLYDMLHEGIDIVNTDDKDLEKWLKNRK